MKKLAAMMLGAAVLVSGCGTIINGKTQDMSVVTTPNFATISLTTSDGVEIISGKGSLQYKLKRSEAYFKGADYNLKISAEGYATQNIPLISKPSGWYLFGNIGFGYFIGWLIVDPITGGMWAIEAQEGQDIENLTVKLLQDVDAKTMKKAIPINPAVRTR